MLVEPAWYIRGEVYEARVRRYRSDDPFTGLFLTESTTNQQLVSLISPECRVRPMWDIEGVASTEAAEYQTQQQTQRKKR